jgi:cyanophycinase
VSFDQNVANNLNFFETGIMKRIIRESKNGAQSRIEIITTASVIPREVGPEYIKAFEYLNAKNVGVLYIEKREQAHDPEVLQRLREADVVMFTGGDQLRLTSILAEPSFMIYCWISLKTKTLYTQVPVPVPPLPVTT